jgi:hypothetical protein
MSKVLVKAVEVRQPSPVLVLGGGDKEGHARTYRESLGGLAGGLVGVAGALTGQHRSLGGLAQSMYNSGSQGARLGRGLGRVFVGREGQQLADKRQKLANQYATARGGDFERYGIDAKRTPITRFGIGRQQNYMADRLAQLNEEKAKERAINDVRRNMQAKGWGKEQERNAGIGANFVRVMEAMGHSPEQTGNYAAQGAAAARSGQGTIRVVDAAGNVVHNNAQQAVIPQVNALPQQTGGAYTEIKEIEDAGNKEAIETGTDMKDNELGDNEVEVIPPASNGGSTDKNTNAIINDMMRSGVPYEKIQQYLNQNNNEGNNTTQQTLF